MPYAPKRHGQARVKRNRQATAKHYDKHKRTGSEFYHSSAWKKLRNRFIRSNPLCVMCEENGRVTPASMVDHITPIKDGGATLDERNLQSLCDPCHNSKTAQEKVGRVESLEI